MHLWRWKNVREHVKYKQYLRSSFSKWLVTIFGISDVTFWSRCMYISLVSSQYVCDCSAHTKTYSSMWSLFLSSMFSACWGVVFLAFFLLFRLGRCSENQLEIFMASRRKPRLMQCTSDVMGMSEKRAWSRHIRTLLHSKSLTMLRISCRSACRIIPRTFSRVETCFFLWSGRIQGGKRRWMALMEFWSVWCRQCPSTLWVRVSSIRVICGVTDRAYLMMTSFTETYKDSLCSRKYITI